jgi:hypothetical protein
MITDDIVNTLESCHDNILNGPMKTHSMATVERQEKRLNRDGSLAAAKYASAPGKLNIL